MTTWDRTASNPGGDRSSSGRVRLRTEPVLPVLRPETNGAQADGNRVAVFDIRDMAVFRPALHQREEL